MKLVERVQNSATIKDRWYAVWLYTR